MDIYVSPVSRLRNWSFIALIVVLNSFGNMLLAYGTKNVPPFDQVGLAGYAAALFTNPWTLLGVALLAGWMFAQLSMLSWSDLTYVLPVTASGYVLTALLALHILHEKISRLRWAGIVLIAFGVIFVAETKPKTVHSSQKNDTVSAPEEAKRH